MWVGPQLKHEENPQQGSVHVYHFAIFEPIEQKLLNLKWLLSLKINLNDSNNFFHKEFEVKLIFIVMGDLT